VAEAEAAQPGSSGIGTAWSPVPIGWSAVESAAQEERAPQEPYARRMGALQWMSHTALHSPAISILSGKTGTPAGWTRHFSTSSYATAPGRPRTRSFISRGGHMMPIVGRCWSSMRTWMWGTVGPWTARLQKAWGFSHGLLCGAVDEDVNGDLGPGRRDRSVQRRVEARRKVAGGGGRERGAA
jgi:hypothetical protein